MPNDLVAPNRRSSQTAPSNNDATSGEVERSFALTSDAGVV